VIGETEGRAGYENCEIIKTIITDSECLWTSKGVDSKPGHDSSAIVILSNNRNVVKIDPGDFRFCPIDMSCAKVGDKKYFADLVRCFEQHGRLFFDWLTHLETDIQVSLPPNTNFKKALTAEGFGGPIKFIRDVCEHKLSHVGLFESGGVLDVDEKGEIRVQAKELYNAYRRWELEDQGSHQMHVKKLLTFTEELEKLNIPYKRMKSIKTQGEKTWSTTAYAINYARVLDGYRELIGDPNYQFRADLTDESD